MNKIGTFEAYDFNNGHNYKTMNLYTENGELGFKFRCNICDGCSGHFIKLSELPFFGYQLDVKNISVEGNIV